VDSTVTARLKRSEVSNNANIKAGAVICWIVFLMARQLAKSNNNGGMGKATVLNHRRHDVFCKYLGEKYPDAIARSA